MAETSGARGGGGARRGGRERPGRGGVLAGQEPRGRAGECPGGPPGGEEPSGPGGGSGPGGLGPACPGSACGPWRGRGGARAPALAAREAVWGLGAAPWSRPVAGHLRASGGQGVAPREARDRRRATPPAGASTEPLDGRGRRTGHDPYSGKRLVHAGLRWSKKQHAGQAKGGKKRPRSGLGQLSIIRRRTCSTLSESTMQLQP